MVWGQAGSRGIDDLVQRVAANDPKLTSLHILKQRRFNHDDAAALAAALSKNTTLTELYASNHPLEPHTAALFASMLAANQHLQALCLGDERMGDEALEALAVGVAASRSLLRLDVSHKGLGPRGARALSGALASCSTLTHLTLSNNSSLADAGLAALCEGPAAWPCLLTLELQGCGLTHTGLQALAASPQAARLVALRLDGNVLGPAAGTALQQLVQHAPHLRELHLRETALEDSGGAALAGTLSSSSSLLRLDLTACGLASMACKALAAAIGHRISLESLHLAGNPAVTDADVAGLAAALCLGASTALVSLDLSGTQACDQAVTALSQAPRLSHLCLVGCPLGQRGATALATSAAAGGFAALSDLSVSGTGLDRAAAQELMDAFAAGHAPALQSLEIGANPAVQDDAFATAVADLRERRPDLQLHWRSGDDPAPGQQD